ncbi:oxidoreductase [Mycena vulgaris]|nr:oxidoreductase [Mycena vulgaris]
MIRINMYIPDLRGKVIFVTGGCDRILGIAGLDKQSILALAKKNPAHILFTGRDADRVAALITQATAAVPAAQLNFVECNMSCETRKTERLDILMFNAGSAARAQEGINHLAHALLIKLRLPTLLRMPDARVVIMTSQAFKGAPSGGIQFHKMRTTQSRFPASAMRYPQSKFANLLLHPGVVNTDMFLNSGWMMLVIKVIQMWKREPIISPETGALTQLWAATVDKKPFGVLWKHTKLSGDKDLAVKLWEWAEKELEGYPLEQS